MIKRLKGAFGMRQIKEQQGFVAIFSVLVIMAVLALLTIGFSNITRQAQKRALDNHLSNQAFYAAESGVSVAVKALREGTGTTDKTECLGGDGFDDSSYSVDTDWNIGVSCLLINSNPPNLVYDNVPVVGTGEPITTVLATQNSEQDISTIQFKWDSEDGGDDIENRPIQASNPQLLDKATWGSDVGMIRVDLVPMTVNPSDRAGLINSSYVFYLYPSTSGNNEMTVQAGLDDQGGTLVTDCNSPGEFRCIARISIPGGGSEYFLRMQAYYNSVRASVAVLDEFHNEVKLRGSQAVIDSTGRANDVYRRVQVRVPINPNVGYLTGMHDVFAIFSSNSICKRYIGAPGSAILDLSDLPEEVKNDPACTIE